MPQNKAAWLTAKALPLEVGEAPYEAPGPKEIIVQTEAVAMNPVDSHMQFLGVNIKAYPAICGCDVAGTVYAVGGEVTEFKVRDRVIANAACLTLGDHYAAFQNYVRTPSNVACKIPESMSFEQTVGQPLAVNTAALGLFGDKFLALTSRPHAKSTQTKEPTPVVFIYGGSSSVGSAAIQLAKAAGFEIVVTAGANNTEYCRQLGAAAVFDYKDAEWVDKAAEALRGKHLAGIYDCISNKATVGSLQQLKDSLKSEAKIVTTLPPPEGFTTSMVWGASMTFDDSLATAIWHDYLPAALENGSYSAKPDPMIAGKGLADIQKGVDTLRNGVSAKKVVVTGIRDE